MNAVGKVIDGSLSILWCVFGQNESTKMGFIEDQKKNAKTKRERRSYNSSNTDYFKTQCKN